MEDNSMDEGSSGQPVSDTHHPKTEGVRTLLGDPKRAVIKLAIPMIVAMSVQTIYNLVDAIWVSGLGADALAAVGFFFPFFFVVIGLSTGIGIGAGSAISRRIGAQDKKGADSVAVHTMIIMLFVAAGFTIPLFIFAENIFSRIGAGGTLGLTLSYARVMIAGSVIIFFTNVSNAILRAEGDAQRAMRAMMLGAGLNIILDPIFIYTLDLGVAGAAWATIISMSVTSLLLFNWLFLKKDTYVSFDFRGFCCDRGIVKDIFRVGLPASVLQLSMALSMLTINVILVHESGTDAVAVYSTGWRVAMLATLPLIGIATAVISVTGAAFGSRAYTKLKTSFIYAIKMGLFIEVCIAAATFVLAPQITSLFTQSSDAARITDDLVTFLRIMCIFYPGVAFGMFSSSLFQGTGKGTNALVVTVLRTLILTPLLALLFTSALDVGLSGVWAGIVVANLTGSAVGFAWANTYIRSLTNPSKQGAEAASSS